MDFLPDFVYDTYETEGDYMGLPEKVLELRTNAGYSHEQLAQLLHVSTRGISRWESGAAQPTHDNLMELSRLFQVPLDVLTGTKEESKATAAEQNLYQELLRIRRSCTLALALAGILFAGVVIGIWINLVRLKDQVETLSSRLSVMKDEIWFLQYDQDLDSTPATGWRAENSLVTYYTYQLEEHDPNTGMMTLYIYAVPKVYEPGMTAVFSAAADGIQTVEVPGVAGAGNAFTCTLKAPAVDELRLSIAFLKNGETHTQFLETITGLVENFQIRIWAKYEGEIHWQGDMLTLPGEISIQMIPVENAPGSKNGEGSLWRWPVSGRVELLSNREVIKTIQIPINDLFTRKVDNGQATEFGDTFYARFTGEISAPKGLELSLLVTVADNFGIEYTQEIPLE